MATKRAVAARVAVPHVVGADEDVPPVPQAGAEVTSSPTFHRRAIGAGGRVPSEPQAGACVQRSKS